MSIPKIDAPVPWLTTEQMVEVDRAMIEDFHIELIQMMENAGRNLAHLARERFLGGYHFILIADKNGNDHLLAEIATQTPG